MPDDECPGMMETLCLRSVEGRAEMDCVRRYFDCLGAIKEWQQKPEHADKAHAMAFVAARDPRKHAGTACWGEGRSAPIWDLDSPAFDKLKDFIRQL